MSDCVLVPLPDGTHQCAACGFTRRLTVAPERYHRRCPGRPSKAASAPPAGEPCGTCGQGAAPAKPQLPDEPGRPRRLALPPLAVQAGGLLGAIGQSIEAAVSGGAVRTTPVERARRRAICDSCPRREPSSDRCTPCGCFCELVGQVAQKDCAEPLGSRFALRIAGAERILHAGGWPVGGVDLPGLVVEPLRPHDVAIAVITAPRPRTTLRETLSGLRRAGFSREIIRLCAEPRSAIVGETDWPGGQLDLHQHARKLGCCGNWLTAAKTLLEETTAEWLLICEDDVELGESAAAALAHATRTLPKIGCLSLYSPLHNLGPSARTAGWHPTTRAANTWGALAWCFPRAVVQRIVDELGGAWIGRELRDATDQRVGLAVAQQGLHFYSHFPSLGKHIGETSSLGHRQREGFRAVGYVPDYAGYRLSTAPLRVGFLTPNLLVGGVERWLQALVAHADRARIEWRVWLANPQAQEEQMIAALGPHATLCTGEEARAWLLRTSDVLIGWGLPGLPELVRGFERPVVLVSHGGPEHKWTRDMLRSAAPAATHWAAVSATAAAAFPKNEEAGFQRNFSATSNETSARPAKARVIANGYVPARLLGGRDRATMRRAWGLPTDEIAVGYVGRISEEKKPQAVARAIAGLRASDPQRKWRAVFVGPAYDAALAERIKRQCPDALFVPATEHVGEVYGALDVGLCASVSEGFCLSNLEMLAVGLPLVATRVGFIPDLEKTVGPVCVPIAMGASPDDLAAAVRLALSPARRSVIEHARQAVLGWTAESSAREWERWLWEIAREQATTKSTKDTKGDARCKEDDRAPTT